MLRQPVSTENFSVQRLKGGEVSYHKPTRTYNDIMDYGLSTQKKN